MMAERTLLIEWIRAEIVGPSRPIAEANTIDFAGRDFVDPVPLRSGPLCWRPNVGDSIEEVLYFDRESPHRKYGCGVLHPSMPFDAVQPDQSAAEASDTLGIEPEAGDLEETGTDDSDKTEGERDPEDASDEFEVTSPDIRHPSTVGISFCVRLKTDGRIVIRLPLNRRFAWQDRTRPEFSLNGRYEQCIRRWKNDQGQDKDAPMWRRLPALLPETLISVDYKQLTTGHIIHNDLELPPGSPLTLRIDLYPRRVKNSEGIWLVTAVLRNTSQPKDSRDVRQSTLYQTYFEVFTEGGSFERYPESQRPFSQLDFDEQSLSLLYRDSATWAIGHGCAAGWDAGSNRVPDRLFADVMPAVETPSMTPDIQDDKGNLIRLSMRELAALPDNFQSQTWRTLQNVADEYRNWINTRRGEAASLAPFLRPVADRHLDAAQTCLQRINRGIEILKENQEARSAFRLANLAMLLQQIATKQLNKRTLRWDESAGIVRPDGPHDSPWQIFSRNAERPDLGYWRAFQIAFLLMSLDGVVNQDSADREIVDLIWFPTGGGKTEAYLAVMAFYMFHQRVLMGQGGPVARDGTNVLMRYTLRMLTTQQFQRAASLICAMEFLRRNPTEHSIVGLTGGRFSLGLWIGGAASPNKIAQARTEVSLFRSDRDLGNPLVLTECPWCRSQIGRYDGPKPKDIKSNQWRVLCLRGIADHPSEGPLLLCPDGACEFGAEQQDRWLPIEVIDERIYRYPPSLVIGTADKFAIIAYRPDSGSLFGRTRASDGIRQTHLPPGLIVQDELHLISGPLGTIYGLYESIFERLCSYPTSQKWIKPKLIASTATIRGAGEQVKSLYARAHVQLFPSPGLTMGDSFFGKYASQGEQLKPGRLYLGIHAHDYGSVLTTQVRAFSSALFRPQTFEAMNRDAWWSLLVFYNSLRELGGAKTLFDSDIRSRLKFIFNRENFPPPDRRNLRIVEELTSRLSQSEIVGMLDGLSTPYTPIDNKSFDVCLASSIIEVGVDIDRLSLMGVVGQPKTTAQYIQVTGRVGRRWWERPGLILTIYNPSKSRDRSHFEQFHAYHRRLYERVEATSATPFALSAIKRALPGALVAWARQFSDAFVGEYAAYQGSLDIAQELVRERCLAVQLPEDQPRSLEELERVRREIQEKWEQGPLEWEEFPPSTTGEYLILWPGQFATIVQKQRGIVVPSSMRQVDGAAELTITQGYQ
jgi:hypothetical protein